MSSVTGTSAITIRRGTDRDTPAVYRILFQAVNDLARRTGADPIPEDLASAAARSAPLFDHMARTAAEFWVAQDDGTGEIVAYARSIEHGDFLELTEFFVLPGHQSAGIGRRLLERAFPDGRGELRVIVATLDVRALSRYIRTGMTERTMIASLVGDAAAVDAPLALVDAVVDPALPLLDELAALDVAIAGFDRGKAHRRWLATHREAHLYRSRDQAVGYAFIGAEGVGPVGALDPADLPGILELVRDRAAALGATTITFEVPMANGMALRHLLSRGFRIDSFLTALLSNRPFGQMDRYVGHSPPLFL